MATDKCELCSKPARFDLESIDTLRCPHCKLIKYSPGDIKLHLCNLNCSKMYWTLESSEYDKASNTVHAEYMLEKDECNHCGERDFPTVSFAGTCFSGSPTIELCIYCKHRKARYDMYLEEDIVCSTCQHIKFIASETKILTCNTRCHRLPWKPTKYLTDKNEPNIKFICQLVNDICKKCGDVECHTCTVSGVKIYHV